MSVTTTYICNGSIDGRACGAVYTARQQSAARHRLPRGWSRCRGFLAPEDRGPRQGARPVLHFCVSCTHRRDKARETLGRMRLRTA